jgi:hypothetical protein
MLSSSEQMRSIDMSHCDRRADTQMGDVPFFQALFDSNWRRWKRWAGPHKRRHMVTPHEAPARKQANQGVAATYGFLD